MPFDDHTVFVDPRDDRIASKILSGQGWQRAALETAFVQADKAGDLKPDGVFVDVGANIGLMTLYAMLSGRFERGIAIEPDPWNREILNRNLDANDLSDRVTVVAKAVSDADGALVLYRDTKNFGAHSLEPGFVMSPDREAERVAVERLDAILAEAGVAPGDVGFVKVDVEGHEFRALAGMPDLLAARPPLMIEVTFDAGGSGLESAELRQLLKAYSSVIDIERMGESGVPLANFEARALQHELLIL